MKRHFYFLIFISLIFCNCTNKKQEIEDSISNKNYLEAQNLLDKLSEKEKLEPQYTQLQSSVNFNILIDSLQSLSKRHNYLEIDSLIVLNTLKIDDVKFIDSLYLIRKNYAFTGADYHYTRYEIMKAYKCVINYIGNTFLDETRQDLIDNLQRLVISGVWEGKSKNKYILELRIKPLSNSTFVASINRKYSERYVHTIQNGFFDGKTLTGTYIIRLPGIRPVLHTFEGKFDGKHIKAKCSFIIQEFYYHNNGGGGVGSSGYTGITTDEFIFSKKDDY